METVKINYKIDLGERILQAELKHGFCFASLKIDGKLFDINYFIGKTVFSLFLSETFIIFSIALTYKGYIYTVETEKGIISSLCSK